MVIELLCYNAYMDNTIFVEYIITQYDLTHIHLITGVIMMVNYPLLKYRPQIPVLTQTIDRPPES